MGKGILFLLFLPAACIAAGLFGTVHDQVSYTVSPEYFTRLKFAQFGLLDASRPERLRAAQVGFLASWWMGIPMGLLCGAAGLVQRTPARMAEALGWTLAVAVAMTFATALSGLAYGLYSTLGMDSLGGWRIPAGVTEPRRFVRVAYMHNAAYLGGALAIPAAWAFNLIFRHLRD